MQLHFHYPVYVSSRPENRQVKCRVLGHQFSNLTASLTVAAYIVLLAVLLVASLLLHLTMVILTI
jgi:hypothetical protein